jgi:hypothetical protein
MLVDRQGFDDVVAIMQRLAEGDEAAVVTLYERFGGPIAAAVHRVAAARGVRLRRDDVAGAVLEVCFELGRVAGAWSPDGGALPWVWAHHRVANVVDHELGQWTEPLDDARLPDVAEPALRPRRSHDAPVWPAFERIVADHESARLLREALDRTGVSQRDRELWLEYMCEKATGNPAPATTLGPVYAMKESAVRQAARRVRRRVRSLATSDEQFAALIDLPLLA